MDHSWIIVPDWDRFQHYKDRDPIWIRTYTRLLHNDAYRDLTGHQRAVLHGLWLAYASSGCQLRANTASLTRQLGLRVSSRTLETLNHAGFITLRASKMVRTLNSTEERREELLTEQTAVASYAAAPRAARTSQTDTERRLPADLLEQITHLGGADRRTTATITAFARRGLPEAAFRNALEATHEARPRLRTSEIAYFVGTLRQIEQDGQYA